MAAVVRLSRFIRATPERVYAYRRDLRNLPKYNPAVTRLRCLDDTWRFDVRIVGRVAAPVRLVVSEDRPPERLVFEMQTWFPARETCQFRPVDGGTRVDFELRVETPRGRLGRLIETFFAEPNGRRQVESELEAIKQQLERG